MTVQRVISMCVVLGLLLALVSGPGLAQEQPSQAEAVPMDAMGTAFTYQGRLETADGPVNGTCDLVFRLYGSAAGTDQIGVDFVPPPVTVTDGYLTVDGLDFGAGAFAADERWLDIQVRCPAGSGTFATLSPRQRLRPAPQAIYAHTANLLAYNPNNVSASVALSWWNDGSLDWPRIRYGGSGAGASSGFLIQGQGNSTKLAVLDSGNVGIGTASPGARLDVAGGSILLDANTAIYGHQTSGSQGFVRLYDGATGDMTLGTTFATGDVAITAGNAERVRVLSSGNVGIGTTSPTARLHVAAAANRWAMYLAGGPTFSNTTLVTRWNLNPTDNGTATMPIITANWDTGSGLGFLRGAEMESPVIWMYSHAGNNAFTVAKKGYAGTGSDVTDIEDTLTPLFQVRVNGRVGIGTVDPQAKLDVAGTTRTDTLQIDAGSDLAEPFAVAGPVAPGMVVAIDPEHAGQLRLAAAAYDRTVAGCVSGANGVQPGLVMRQEGTPGADGGWPVALSGRVYCLADARYGPIHPGDLLTTSDTPGHAMAVLDHGRAQGAILGKAMTALDEGQGYVLVLVTLQ